MLLVIGGKMSHNYSLSYREPAIGFGLCGAHSMCRACALLLAEASWACKEKVVE